MYSKVPRINFQETRSPGILVVSNNVIDYTLLDKQWHTPSHL